MFDSARPRPAHPRHASRNLSPTKLPDVASPALWSGASQLGWTFITSRETFRSLALHFRVQCECARCVWLEVQTSTASSTPSSAAGCAYSERGVLCPWKPFGLCGSLFDSARPRPAHPRHASRNLSPTKLPDVASPALWSGASQLGWTFITSRETFRSLALHFRVQCECARCVYLEVQTSTASSTPSSAAGYQSKGRL